MKILSRKSVAPNTLKNQSPTPKRAAIPRKRPRQAPTPVHRATEALTQLPRMGKENAKIKMRMKTMRARTAVQRGQKICCHLPETPLAAESLHVPIESMTQENIAFGTGALVH